jgi:hypothetical protein
MGQHLTLAFVRRAVVDPVIEMLAVRLAER